MIHVKTFFITFFTIVYAVSSYGQANLLNAKKPSQIGIKSAAQLSSDNDKPLAYGYVDDRDILMSRTTWEVIDLGEKINFPLYFPIDTLNIGPDRRSLYDVLIKGIKRGKITQIYNDGYFTSKKTVKDITSNLVTIKLSKEGKKQIDEKQLQNKYTSFNNIDEDVKKQMIKDGISEDYFLTYTIESDAVVQFKIKGLWYFDKRQGELKYRLLGLCPVVIDNSGPEISNESESQSNNSKVDSSEQETNYIELFWVFFPDARETLYAAKAFNEKNSSMPISFDQLLNARRFNSVIYKEENVYGDREIKDYLANNALNQLLESDRIKDKIRSFEQDMWSY
jgi:gliding motility associated protien GldN